MSLTKASAATSSVPLRGLLVLGAAVVLAHLAVLQTLPAVLQVNAPGATTVRALNTRSIPAPVPAPPPVPVAKPPAPHKPRPTPRAAEPAPEPVDSVAVADASPVAPLPDPAASAAEAAAPAASEPIATPVPPPPAPAPEPVASAPVPPAHAIAEVTQATAFRFADPVRLLYNLTGASKGLHYNARGELLWQQNGQQYSAQLSASLLFLGSRTRTSAGAITPAGLAPQRFSDKWRSEVAAHFDYDKGRATFSANTPDVPLLPAAQDQLSVVLQIAGMLAADPAHYPVGSSITLQTVGPRDADIWKFNIEGPDKAYVPYDSMDILKLTRVPQKEFERKVELWLGPSISYLPVRLKITEPNGDFLDQQLRAVEKP
ncbi:MAG: DUF3108 domain-containing protein [Burkholderiales bacterium]|nr:DUF3108 domain-containing protein [Burkholderiales bacterium]